MASGRVTKSRPCDMTFTAANGQPLASIVFFVNAHHLVRTSHLCTRSSRYWLNCSIVISDRLPEDSTTDHRRAATDHFDTHTAMTTESNIDLQKLTLEPSDKNKTGSQEDGEGQANITTGLSHMCAICATPAKLCCAACSSTHLKEEGISSTWYCGKDCQTKDWPAHKIHCKEIRAKVDFRSLKRAARILHALFEQDRRTGFDLSIADATRKGRLLYVKEGEYDFKQTFLPGYAHVEASTLKLEPDDHAMLLGMMCCDDVMIQFHECCSLFLRGMPLHNVVKPSLTLLQTRS